MLKSPHQLVTAAANLNLGNDRQHHGAARVAAAAAEITLTADILDRIDQLVAPGVTILTASDLSEIVVDRELGYVDELTAVLFRFV